MCQMPLSEVTLFLALLAMFGVSFALIVSQIYWYSSALMVLETRQELVRLKYGLGSSR